MTRKPKLNLLYATESSTPWLELAVACVEPSPSNRHAQHWLAARFAQPAPQPPTPLDPHKH